MSLFSRLDVRLLRQAAHARSWQGAGFESRSVSLPLRTRKGCLWTSSRKRGDPQLQELGAHGECREGRGTSHKRPRGVG